MICSKCGTVLPDDAEYCGECGAKIERAKATTVSLSRAKVEAKRYKIISLILAALCVVFGMGWIMASHDPYKSIDNYEKDAAEIERAGIELTGTYVVGEDSELPEGRYNIYPPDGESYMDVNIYENMEDAKKKYDKDYNSYALEHLYSLARGYKLKAGQVVVIEYDSAYFELVSEEPTEAEASQAESSEESQSDETEPVSESE